ncbi:NAD P-binding protein [Gloeophyllum trabeum ATCC 11539]|uniref:NAD P-binding protein n=1 Tax=Gloeophyllum trabeum (strain ATCC 11539 / FP-39264 / Madison 617) TaxID=670483 RepID=S7Q567_GLOTA|nr:NAD P-binding protein [Gloeophyllum trabeum ATCC 11539]EPQ54653.1 NAD P-binding protein [Gloeophyllum trabeum ATCC 11539]
MIDNVFPPKAKWGVDDIPDLTGKVMIVTGSNTGIGKETVKALLNHNAKVYMACRSKTKAEAAIAQLKEETGKAAIYIHLDLMDLRSIKVTAEELESRLDVLFNNAGIMFPPIDDLTKDGYDAQFGTNVIGHFFLTKLLLPVLLATAQTSPEHTARVINTSSFGHTGVSKLDFDTMRDGPARRKLGRYQLYSQSKFGNIVFSNELARRYGKDGIVSVSLHPGMLKTDLANNASFFKAMVGWTLYPAPMGALTQLYAGTTPDAAALNGKYLKPWARIGKARKETDDPETARRLWEWLEEQVKDV